MSASNPCGGCKAACCRVYRVPVNGSDVHRLSRGLLLPVEAFAGLKPMSSDERGTLCLDREGGRFSLHLHRRADGACTMLVTLLDGTSRCGAYAHRPGTCRVYPSTRDKNDVISIRADSVCQPDACGVESVPEDEWRDAWTTREIEWMLYERVLAAWEATLDARLATGPVVAATYLGWLTEVYRRIDDLWLGRDPEVPVGDLPALFARAERIAGAVG